MTVAIFFTLGDLAHDFGFDNLAVLLWTRGMRAWLRQHGVLS